MSLSAKIAEFRPALRRRIHEDIAEQLRDAILDGRFPEGGKLPPERELALQFRVNRTSIRDAIKVLEGLNLVHVRQGDGATVQPLATASFDLLPAMIFRSGRVDFEMFREMVEVVRPALFEMAHLALVRAGEKQIQGLRALSARMADDRNDEESRAAAAHELLVALAEMSRNRVWRMLAARLRTLLDSEPMREARRRIHKDHGRLAMLVNDCIAYREAGRFDDAVAALRRAVEFLGEGLEQAQSIKGRRGSGRL